MTKNEQTELLRYFLGRPVPYIQDARFRELAEQFLADDAKDRDNITDPRVPPSQRDDDGVEVSY